MEKSLVISSGPENTINTTHFKIHYTTSGGDSVTPAYAESIAVYAEHVWDEQVTNLGYEPPLPDYGNGGDDLYDIYIQGIGDAGYAQPEDTAPDTHPYEDAYTSFVGIGDMLTDDEKKIFRSPQVSSFLSVQLQYVGDRILA
ncbi:MAG: hypothetical protein QMD71_03755 [bacterium]|nr:hypothetical protein [bacterium]